MINKIDIRRTQPASFKGSGIVPNFSKCPKNIRDILYSAGICSINCNNDAFSYQASYELEQEFVKILRAHKVEFRQYLTPIDFSELKLEAEKIKND